MAGEKKVGEKICPACGKPTAGYVPCPHCGADPSVRLSLKVVGLLCAVALVAGSAYLFLSASTLGAKPISISSIDSWMNYASVWIEGTVVYGPKVTERSISFEVQDASGESIEVDVYAKPRDLKSQGKIPMVGDHVKLFGMLRVYPDRPTEIRVSSFGIDRLTGEDKYQVTLARPNNTTIHDLVNTWGTPDSLKNKRVTLEGTIIEMRPLYAAKLYKLRDNRNAAIELYVHNGLKYVSKEKGLRLLQTIRVTAGASETRYGRQLALASYDDVEWLENGTSIQVEFENVGEEHRNQIIRTSGKIIFVEMVGESGSLKVEKRKLWLQENTNLPIQISEEIYKCLTRDNQKLQKLLIRGSEVRLTGKVSPYGKLMIELIGPPELELVSGTYEPPLVENVARITGDNEDEVVKVKGKIVKLENVAAEANLPSHRKFTLQDDLGERSKFGFRTPSTSACWTPQQRERTTFTWSGGSPWWGERFRSNPASRAM